MRKIDKLILGSFIGPFVLTFFVVVFILLTQFMLKYFDEIVGKDLDTIVIAELIFYFSIFMTPNAFPLAVLLSSLMTFGNLGEHFEMTAIKSAGISLTRTLVPIFIFSTGLTWAAFYSNNYVVPKANLKAFSLLYDVKQKKPSMEIREGTFYNGIDGYSIKVNKKLPDDMTLKEIIIYNHTQGNGNKEVILADSGIMYNIMNGRYLMLELFKGHSYSEQRDERRRAGGTEKPEPYVRNEFDKSKIAFSLASFDLKRTREDLFANNRLMKNSDQLSVDIDSMGRQYVELVEEIQDNSFQFFDYHLSDLVVFYKNRAAERQERKRLESIARGEQVNRETAFQESGVTAEQVPMRSDTVQVTDPSQLPSPARLLRRAYSKMAANSTENQDLKPDPGTTDTMNSGNNSSDSSDVSGVIPQSVPDISDLSIVYAKIDSAFGISTINRTALDRSLALSRRVKNHLMVQIDRLEKLKVENTRYRHERAKKLSNAVTILVMFLIGAPLGTIIKRGGLGIPVILSVFFFILFYVISMICDKWARRELMDPVIAAWSANIVLLPVGLFFLRQARNDSPLLDMDYYSVKWKKLKNRWRHFLLKFKSNT